MSVVSTVVVAQLVEPQIVILVVAGSSPVDHPIFFQHKQILLILAVVALVGCGEREYTNTRDLKPNTPAPEPVAETKNPFITDPIVEKAMRERFRKPTGELTMADLGKVWKLDLDNNQLTDVKGLEKFTKLTFLNLKDNPDLTKAQIAQLQKALPKCGISSNPKK